MLVCADVGARGALAAVRALGRAGVTVGVGSPAPTPATRSRWCAADHVLPEPEAGVDAFVSAVDRLGYDVVLPATDAALAALASGADGLRAALPFPAEAALGLLDKQRVADAAARVGLRAPVSYDEHDAPLPAVVKPRTHWSPGAPGRVESVVVDTPSALQAQVAAVRAAGGEPLVQPFLAGSLVAVVIVAARDGTRLGWVQQRADAVWPSPAGVSCRAVTEPPDAALVDGVFGLLAELGWWGVAQAQFLADADGMWLIDLNGRLYGSLPLALAAGVPVPELLVSVALGRAVAVVGGGRPGVRFRWVEGDLRRAWRERSVAPLLARPGAAAALWAADDRGPAWWTAQDLASRLPGRLARGRRS